MFKQTNSRILLWILFILTISIPLLVRYLNGAPLTPLDSSYIHLTTITGLYDYLLFFFPAVIPGLLGIISFALLTKMKDYSLLLFIITPLTITMFTAYNPAALFFPLAIAGFLARKKYPWITLIITPLLVFTDPIAAFITIIFFTAYLFKNRQLLGIGTLALLALSLTYVILTQELPTITPLPLFGEFGSAFGYSLFVLFLGAVFVIQHWRTINAGYVFGWVALFLVSIYVPTLRPLVLLPLVIYAAGALEDLTKNKWNLHIVKQASFILLICLGIFVVLTHVKVLALATPQAPLTELMDRADIDVRPGAILTTTAYDDSLRALSQRTIVTLPPDDPFWQTITLAESSGFLQENNIRFIIVTPDMVQGDVWDREEGLLFLIQNNGKFINVQSAGEYQLWLVLKEWV